MKIFAYGSNLSSDRLRDRVPSATFIGRARLNGYCLRFHKRGADGSGKANAFRTGSANDCVWGAIFECPDDEKAVLDDIENGYNSDRVPVELDEGRVERVWVYLADPAAIDETLKPYAWYHDYVLIGAEEHGLAAEYVERLRDQSAIRDPDPEREARHVCPA